jgi:hypothetical protein
MDPYKLYGIFGGMPNGKNFYELEKTSYAYKYRGVAQLSDGSKKTVFWSSYSQADAQGLQSGYSIIPGTVVILEQGYETLP